MRPNAPADGFTLIELLLALGLLALLLFLGMPSFTEFVRNSQVRSTSESIINGLRTAASEATNRNALVAFTLAGGNDPSWAVNVVNDIDTMQLQQPPIQAYARKEAGTNTTVAITGDKPYVVFNGLGRIRTDPANPNDHIRQIDVSTVVPGEGRSLRIIVDDPNPADPAKPRGMRMCDPDPALAALVPPDPRAC